MLSSVPLAYLWLMAAIATAISTFAVIKAWPQAPARLRILFPLLTSAGGGGMALEFHLRGYSPAGGLTMYAFGLIGCTVGATPLVRAINRQFAETNGVAPKGGFKTPRRQAAFLAVCLTVSLFAASIVTD
ncbi:hypothetical protein [Streptomyces sp. NPDC046821]|uniref:hypothetical protein n=1 Tax=Streptomyces sp. NPDC046821 TaxID=3154702 RepID=UPI003408EFB9